VAAVTDVTGVTANLGGVWVVFTSGCMAKVSMDKEQSGSVVDCIQAVEY
jgi:hypothetical protein